MKTSLETRLGIFFALTAVAAVLLIELSGGVDVFRKGYTLHADFKTIGQLKAGDPIKMAGVPIGRVIGFDFIDDKVRVSMKITEGRKVKTDAIARIQSAGLVGQNYVALNIGAADSPAFEADGVVQTEELPDINAIMKKLDNVAGGIENLTKSFSGDSIQNVLGPLTDFMKQNNPKITSILGDMQVVSANLREGKGTMGRFITDERLYTEAVETVRGLNQTAADARLLLTDAKSSLSKVTGTFDEAQSIFGDLKLTLQGARQTMDRVNAGEGTIGMLLHDTALYTNSTAAMATLREIFDKINRGEGSAGMLVNDPGFYDNAKMTLQKIDKATEGLEDTGPLSVFGTAINGLF
jgi:phospholipid/cholesterol/gamma-HCH transport system substrate-binding protein